MARILTITTFLRCDVLCQATVAAAVEMFTSIRAANENYYPSGAIENKLVRPRALVGSEFSWRRMKLWLSQTRSRDLKLGTSVAKQSVIRRVKNLSQGAI